MSLLEDAKAKIVGVVDIVKDKADEAGDKAQGVSQDVPDQVQEKADGTKTTIEEKKQDLEDKLHDT
jgi:hypothetical protein